MTHTPFRLSRQTHVRTSEHPKNVAPILINVLSMHLARYPSQPASQPASRQAWGSFMPDIVLYPRKSRIRYAPFPIKRRKNGFRACPHSPKRGRGRGFSSVRAHLPQTKRRQFSKDISHPAACAAQTRQINLDSNVNFVDFWPSVRPRRNVERRQKGEGWDIFCHNTCLKREKGKESCTNQSIGGKKHS